MGCYEFMTRSFAGLDKWFRRSKIPGNSGEISPPAYFPGTLRIYESQVAPFSSKREYEAALQASSRANREPRSGLGICRVQRVRRNLRVERVQGHEYRRAHTGRDLSSAAAS